MAGVLKRIKDFFSVLERSLGGAAPKGDIGSGGGLAFPEADDETSVDRHFRVNSRPDGNQRNFFVADPARPWTRVPAANARRNIRRKLVQRNTRTHRLLRYNSALDPIAGGVASSEFVRHKERGVYFSINQRREPQSISDCLLFSSLFFSLLTVLFVAPLQTASPHFNASSPTNLYKLKHTDCECACACTLCVSVCLCLCVFACCVVCCVLCGRVDQKWLEESKVESAKPRPGCGKWKARGQPTNLPPTTRAVVSLSEEGEQINY